MTTLLFALFIHAQHDNENGGKSSPAEFPGGDKALKHYINYHYRDTEFYVGEIRRPEVSFTIDEVGDVKDIQFIFCLGKSEEDCILSLLKNMPEWEPAYKQGIPVASQYTMTIPFGEVTREGLDSLYFEGRPMKAPEVMPKYFDSQDSFHNYVSQRLKTLCEGGGQPVIGFVVDFDGSLTEFTVLRSSGCPEFDSDIIRILSDMPAWSIPMYKDKPVRCFYNLKYCR